MKHKGIIASFGVLVLLVVGMLVFMHLKSVEIAISEPVHVPIDEPSHGGSAVTGEHVYTNGMHTVLGELEVPTPCHAVNAESRVMESYPEQVIIDLTLTTTSEVCAQGIAIRQFTASFSASEHAVIRATLDGTEIQLDLERADGVPRDDESFPNE